MRLSVSACSEPEKMLLNPRATTLVDWIPVVATSTPGTLRRWSTGVTAGRAATCISLTTSTRAGASVAFSGRLEALTTTGSSRTLPNWTFASTREVWPARTTASMRRTGMSVPEMTTA